MQHKKRKKRKTWRNYLGKIIVLFIIFLYFISRMGSFSFISSSETYTIQHGKIQEIVSTNGLIVRAEKHLGTLSEGEIKYYVNDGERVAAGQRIAEVRLQDLDEKAHQSLESVDLKIESMENIEHEAGIFQRDIEKLDDQIEAVMNKIQGDIQLKRYNQLEEYREQLQGYINKKDSIMGQGHFEGQDLTELTEQRQNLLSEINRAVQVIISDEPGVIGMGSDGLESVLTLKSINEISVDNVELFETNHEVEERGIRLITDHQWSIVTILRKDEQLGFDEGRTVRVKPQGQEREYRAQVRSVIEEEESTILILDLTEHMPGFYHHRRLDFDIIKNSYEGAVVPHEAVVEQEGKIGVYRVDVNGFARFIPIEMRTQNSEYALIHDGSFRVTEDNEEPVTVRTVNLYDEIIENARRVSDGDRIR
ncbi:hypothetical protein Amet_2805 [Alkaliphilus metalliredigens QYMF]|uniref:Uncharacterized protein n=1 Tax=Alkaliphilus metalliredigens (strain QYMF) TaxID=293826 RepID=A6TRY7_ALKMQ|nr:HlyD family efflux transporter periplasmic adaptor subunit [Alkaliphilus metalliredigens]ABR48955.1 hypothetical protein Amet_2805 [Alkaliphilus metalliredigens QYMF]